jgi:Holliday junction resolvasome RuvABC endonuclease subunit
VDLDLQDLEYEIGNDDVIEKEYTKLSEDSVVPKQGNYLGLDISVNSTGICLYRDGIKTTANIALDYQTGNPHAEVLLRRQLKTDLLELIKGLSFEVIVIEDVFEGVNPDTTRKLYALNTAIDELILDEQIECKHFIRVPNTLWKSWLSSVDANGVYKGFNDKQKIQGYLKLLGIDEGNDKGFQDRLDATGMLLGYLIGRDSNKGDLAKAKSIRVKFDDIMFAYELDTDLIVMQAAYESEEANVVFIRDKKITKKAIIDYISSDVGTVFITAEPIRLGLLAETLNIELLNTKGYFGFWLNDKMKTKYLKKQQKLGI